MIDVVVRTEEIKDYRRVEATPVLTIVKMGKQQKNLTNRFNFS